MKTITPDYLSRPHFQDPDAPRILERMFDSVAATGPPQRAASPGSPGGRARTGPPGWPPRVPPPEAPGWRQPALNWLLDQCPPDYRRYAAWHRHPLALAWLTVRHVDAQVEAMREGYRGIRVDIGDQLGPEGVHDVLAALELEGARLMATRRSAALLLEAFQGRRFIPRL